MCTQGLSAPVWDQTQTDPLPCARGLNMSTWDWPSTAVYPRASEASVRPFSRPKFCPHATVEARIKEPVLIRTLAPFTQQKKLPRVNPGSTWVELALVDMCSVNACLLGLSPGKLNPGLVCVHITKIYVG